MRVKKNKKKIKIVSLVFVVTAIMIFTKFVFVGNTKFTEKEVYVKIPHESNYEDAKRIISKYVDNYNEFEIIAKMIGYPKKVKSGRFLFKKGMSSVALNMAMRRNIVVKISFNNQERLEDLAGKVSKQIQADSLSLLKSFRDTVFMKANDFNEANIFAVCLPNTYEMYWDTTAEVFRDKMLKAYHIFWNTKRIKSAKDIGLTPVNVIILASIVHKESVKKIDRPKIAAVYLNRIKLNMPLQADPTIIYGLKKRDNNFSQIIRRVFLGDLKIESPFNTYTNLGLPPSPIAMPDIDAIDAVLKPDKNKYLYFCASVKNFGYSEFSETYEEHVVVAKKYTDWIKSKAINR